MNRLIGIFALGCFTMILLALALILSTPIPAFPAAPLPPAAEATASAQSASTTQNTLIQAEQMRQRQIAGGGSAGVTFNAPNPLDTPGQEWRRYAIPIPQWRPSTPRLCERLGGDWWLGACYGLPEPPLPSGWPDFGSLPAPIDSRITAEVAACLRIESSPPDGTAGDRLARFTCAKYGNPHYNFWPVEPPLR